MAVLPHTPQPLYGPWQLGLALDLHTVSSEFIGYDEYGHPQYDTKRTEVGEALYRLKYSQEAAPADSLAETAVVALSRRGARVDLVVPVPATRARAIQPVAEVGRRIATLLAVPFADTAVARTQQLPQLKDIADFGERQRLLSGAHVVDAAAVQGKSVLLFDDL